MIQWNCIRKLNDDVINVLSSVPFKTSYCSRYFDGELEIIGDDYDDVKFEIVIDIRAAMFSADIWLDT